MFRIGLECWVGMRYWGEVEVSCPEGHTHFRGWVAVASV